MKEFRIPNQEVSYKRHDIFIRIGLWSMVAVLASIAVFSIHYKRTASAQLNIALAFLTALIVVGIVVAANMLAARNGINKAQRCMSFVLTDDSLVYKRIGHADIQIE